MEPSAKNTKTEGYNDEYVVGVDVESGYNQREEYRCVMSGKRCFTFYEGGYYSVDSMTKSQCINKGKMEVENEEYKFHALGNGDELVFFDWGQDKLRVFNPVTGNFVDGWDQKVSQVEKHDSETRFLNTTVRWTKHGVLVQETEKVSDTKSKVYCQVFTSGTNKAVYKYSQEGEDQKVLYLGGDKVIFAKTTWTKTQEVKFRLWTFSQEQSVEYTMALATEMNCFVEAAHLACDGDWVCVYFNTLIQELEEWNGPRVVCYSVKEAKVVQDCSLGPKDKDHECCVLYCLTTKADVGVLTCMGKANDQNLVHFNVKTGKITKAQCFSDMPRFTLNDCMDPMRNVATNVYDSFNNEGELDQVSPMKVFNYLLALDNHLYTCEAWERAGDITLSKNLLGEVLALMYGRDMLTC